VRHKKRLRTDPQKKTHTKKNHTEGLRISRFFVVCDRASFRGPMQPVGAGVSRTAALASHTGAHASGFSTPPGRATPDWTSLGSRPRQWRHAESTPTPALHAVTTAPKRRHQPSVLAGDASGGLEMAPLVAFEPGGAIEAVRGGRGGLTRAQRQRSDSQRTQRAQRTHSDGQRQPTTASDSQRQRSERSEHSERSELNAAIRDTASSHTAPSRAKPPRTERNELNATESSAPRRAERQPLAASRATASDNQRQPATASRATTSDSQPSGNERQRPRASPATANESEPSDSNRERELHRSVGADRTNPKHATSGPTVQKIVPNTKNKSNRQSQRDPRASSGFK